MTAPRPPRLASRSDVTPIWFFDNVGYVAVRQADTDGRLSMVELAGAAGDMPPLHRHDADDELFHMLEGAATFYVGDEQVHAVAGDVVLAPSGVPHTYRITSPEGARWMVTTAPGQFAGFVDATARPADGWSLPPAPDGPPAPDDVEQLTALAREHGVEILGPPGMLPTEL